MQATNNNFHTIKHNTGRQLVSASGQGSNSLGHSILLLVKMLQGSCIAGTQPGAPDKLFRAPRVLTVVPNISQVGLPTSFTDSQFAQCRDPNNIITPDNK